MPTTAMGGSTRRYEFREKALRTCHCFNRYPNETGKRNAEGGLRLQGLAKPAAGAGEPLVSIITVCLNSVSTIGQCIESVSRQSYGHIEYIVIDGGSTDGTIDIVQKYQNKIDYYVSEPDSGLYHAMNKGLSVASGDYILFLNSDDWYAPECVETLVASKRDHSADFVSALAEFVDRDGNASGRMRPMPFDDSVRLRMPLRHETMLIPAEIYNEVGGYDENYTIVADFELAVRLFECGYSHYQVQKPLVYFREAGVSRNVKSRNRTQLEHVKVIQKSFSFLTHEEAMVFTEYRSITPQRIMNLAEKYACEKKFVQTLQAYIEDRKQAQESQEWETVMLPERRSGMSYRAAVRTTLSWLLRG